MEIKGYGNRRDGYEKLDGSGCRRRKSDPNDVAEEAAKPKSSWRTKLTTTQKFDKLVKACDAKKFCVRLRDSYVDFMIRNAGTRVLAEGIGGGYGGATDDPFGIGSLKYVKEYDEEKIIETYKSGDLVPHRIAPRVGS